MYCLHFLLVLNTYSACWILPQQENFNFSKIFLLVTPLLHKKWSFQLRISSVENFIFCALPSHRTWLNIHKIFRWHPGLNVPFTVSYYCVKNARIRAFSELHFPLQRYQNITKVIPICSFLKISVHKTSEKHHMAFNNQNKKLRNHSEISSICCFRKGDMCWIFVINFVYMSEIIWFSEGKL